MTGAVRALAALLFLFAPSAAGAAGEPIEITARAIPRFDPARTSETRFGALVYRGGLVLRSPARGFGGWSGLRLDASGEKLLACSDRGHWLEARLVHDGRALAGIADARIAPMIGPNGPLPGSRDFDCEGIEVVGGTAWAAIERTHRLLRFDIGRDGLAARGRPVPLPREAVRGLPSNRSFEAVGVPRSGPLAGAVILVTEEHLDAAGNHIGWIVGGRRPGRFTVKRHDGYAVTDLAILPSGNIVMLERRARPPFFLSTRIRKLMIGDIVPGAVVDGPVLLEASLSQEIDNLEGISAHRGPDGATVLTLISDDNFSAFQRTLLLQFELRE